MRHGTSSCKLLDCDDRWFYGAAAAAPVNGSVSVFILSLRSAVAAPSMRLLSSGQPPGGGMVASNDVRQLTFEDGAFSQCHVTEQGGAMRVSGNG